MNLETLENAPAVKPIKRVLEIDILRGIAILLVIGHHGVLGNEAGRLYLVDRIWHRIGWTGVDLFFVLSGFLVGGLLLKEAKTHKRIDIKRFVIRRAFKIMPSYYIYLLAVFLLLTINHRLSLRDIVSHLGLNFFHLQNYTQASNIPRELPHTWSLAIEEHFYLILPVILLGLVNRGIKSLERCVPIVCGFAMITCPILRVLNSSGNPSATGYVWAELHQWPTHLRIDSLFCGVLLAWLYHFRKEFLNRANSHPARVILCGLALISPAATANNDNIFIWTIGYTTIALGYALILSSLTTPAIQATRLAPLLNNAITRGIAFIGTYSYSIYLWHIMLGQITPRWFANRPWLHSMPEVRWITVNVLFILSATLIGVIFGKSIEYPMLALRDRWFPSRTT